MRRQLLPALVTLLCLTVLVGLAYPLVVTGIAQVAFGHRADGSLVTVDGQVVGSELLGQGFTDTRYFWPRPSAAGDGYDPLASGASNLGPSDTTLLSSVAERAAAYRDLNGLAPDTAVPVDAVTSSASGLDPHISIENARLQAPRVARERGMPVERVLALVDGATEDAPLGVLGADGVNVLRLNLALDAASATG